MLIVCGRETLLYTKILLDIIVHEVYCVKNAN